MVPKILVWPGVWELIFALAVALSGYAKYDKFAPFLLRLRHQSSRSSYEDYPQPPDINGTVLSYVQQFFNLDIF